MRRQGKMKMKVKPDKDILNIVNLYIADNFSDVDDFESIYMIVEKAYIDGVLAVLENDKPHSRNNDKQQETKNPML